MDQDEDITTSIFLYLKRYWLFIILSVITLNIVFLNIYFFLPKTKSAVSGTPSSTISFAPQSSCPQSCVDQMNLLLNPSKAVVVSPSVAKGVTGTLTPTIDTSATPTATPTPTLAPVNVREFFVPLGVGSSTASDWTVITGIGAKIDTADYGNIKAATFEVTVWVPTGNQTVWIRLYNANTFQTVVGSEMTMSGGTPTLLISSPITLVTGDNLYQIQVKTQLGFTVKIDMARIRIKVN